MDTLLWPNRAIEYKEEYRTERTYLGPKAWKCYLGDQLWARRSNGFDERRHGYVASLRAVRNSRIATEASQYIEYTHI